jgi:hypothetical protein
MDEARRKDLNDRFGADPAHWPAPYRAEVEGRNSALLAALDLPYDEAALSRAVLTALAAPATPRRLRVPLPLAFATYASLALAFGVVGYQGAAGLQGLQDDQVLELALGSVTGVLQ